ncbi:unnamed protein product [Anisakis simplex]|uniref:Uncharacterized protein n=1 Tax=Anisakis simplex TaxID=6269 RepID=A0A0M3JLE4_ANISI|nr:unnamed protein product [Anisakis simplex]
MEYVGAGSGTSRSVLEQAEDYVKVSLFLMFLIDLDIYSFILQQFK